MYAAETLGDALVRRASLRPGESIVTREGLWLGRDWLRVARAELEDGVLARERALEEGAHRARRRSTSPSVDAGGRDGGGERARESEHDRRRETLQHAANDTVRALAAVRSRLAAERQRREQDEQRARRLDEELGEIRGALENDRAELEVASARRADALAALEGFEAERESGCAPSRRRCARTSPRSASAPTPIVRQVRRSRSGSSR